MILLHGTGHFHVHQLMGENMWIVDALLIWCLASVAMGLILGPILKRASQVDQIELRHDDE